LPGSGAAGECARAGSRRRTAGLASGCAWCGASLRRCRRWTRHAPSISRRTLLGTAASLVVAADSEPRQLNPAIVASNGVFFVASKVIEPLADASYYAGGPRPLLATGWKGSDDGLSITFTLRDGVLWHDGTPFTSADVAFSAMEVWKPLQNIGRGIFANLEAVDTPDETTAVFRFSRPTPLQLVANALPVVSAVLPKHVYAGTDIAANPSNAALVGTGPFLWGEYRPGEYYLLKKNPTGMPASRDSTRLSPASFRTALRRRARSRRARSSSPPSPRCRSSTSTASRRYPGSRS
jgi:ABC-type transport system substrate-binding protein